MLNLLQVHHKYLSEDVKLAWDVGYTTTEVRSLAKALEKLISLSQETPGLFSEGKWKKEHQEALSQISEFAKIDAVGLGVTVDPFMRVVPGYGLQKSFGDFRKELVTFAKQAQSVEWFRMWGRKEIEDSIMPVVKQLL